MRAGEAGCSAIVAVARVITREQTKDTPGSPRRSEGGEQQAQLIARDLAASAVFKSSKTSGGCWMLMRWNNPVLRLQQPRASKPACNPSRSAWVGVAGVQHATEATIAPRCFSLSDSRDPDFTGPPEIGRSVSARLQSNTHHTHSGVLSMTMALAAMVWSSVLLPEGATAFVQPPPPVVSGAQRAAGMKNMLITPHFVQQRRARSTRTAAISMAADAAVDDGGDLPRVLWCVRGLVLKESNMQLKHDVCGGLLMLFSH